MNLKYIKQENSVTLGYSEDSGVNLLEVDRLFF